MARDNLSYKMIFMSERAYGLFRNDINKRLIAKLEEQKAKILLFPAPLPAPVNAGQSVDLSEFDWIIFPDLYSVDFFLARVRERFELDDLRVCALGEAVADKLRFSQLHADVIPAKVDAGRVFSALAGYEAPENSRFLIPKGSGYKGGFSALLENAGAIVKELPVYETGEIAELSRFKTLLMGGAIDEFIFSSPQEVFDIRFFIDPENLDCKISAADEIAFQTLQEFDLLPVRTNLKIN